MGEIKSFYLPGTPENQRLLKNLERIQSESKMKLGPIIIEALNEWTERYMRIHQRQTTFNEKFETKTVEEDLIANRDLIANSSKKEVDPRDLEWLNSDARKEAIAKAVPQKKL